jgi:hypothetical protein
MGIFNHAEGKALYQSDITEILLQSPTLESPGREFPLSQLGKKPAFHQAMKPRLDYLLND